MERSVSVASRGERLQCTLCSRSTSGLLTAVHSKGGKLWIDWGCISHSSAPKMSEAPGCRWELGPAQWLPPCWEVAGLHFC